MLQPDEIQQELMAIFQPELEEHLETLNKGLMALEQGHAEAPRAELLSAVFRSAHSIKGAARAVGLEDIEAVAHRMEEALGQVRKHNSTLLPAHADTLLAAVDTIRDIMSTHLRHETYAPAQINALFVRLDSVTREVESESVPQQFANAPAGEDTASAPTGTTPFESDLFAPVLPHKEGAVTRRSNAGTDAVATPGKGNVNQPSGLGQQSSGPGSASDDIRSVRVSTGKLDTLMDNMGELLVARMRMGQLVEEVRQLQTQTAAWQKDWRKVRAQMTRLQRAETFHPRDAAVATPAIPSPNSAPDSVSPSAALLNETLTASDREIKAIKAELDLLLRRMSSDHNHLQLVTSDLQDSIRNMRMLPIATLFDFFPRMVRDLARERGKEVFLQTEGTNTEVDRQALELLKDPLTHLVRNAIDHGIEAPMQREVAGKPAHGILRLRAEQRGDRLVLEVSDDGKGIDVKALRQAAVERGMLSEHEAAALSDEEALELMFRPGLSTAHKVSSISGRGVGMDVVRKNIEQLRGVIQVHTELGQGARFTMTLPLTLSTSNVLLVQTAGQVIALPLMNVERIMRVNSAQVGAIENKPAIHLDDRLLPLFDLAHLLELPGASAQQAERFPVVIVGLADRRLAVRVDTLLSTQEVVIKPMGRQVRRVRNIAGAAVLGNGQVVLILNMADLMKTMQNRPAQSPPTVSAPSRSQARRVLVVDDSITTRTLVKHILRNAEYDVVTAADGLEAWQMLSENEGTDQQVAQSLLPDVIVSDINMPNMDGFALTEAVKRDPRLARIPVILVTSLDSPEDRVRGMEAGADAYIVKSSFDQRELLETIERLIG